VKGNTCAFLLVQIYFAGDKLLTTPNPDVNEDMKMFEMLV
jgi:biotin synthase